VAVSPSSEPPEPTLLRPPLQDRSRASLERVLAAGQSLLEEEGFEGFTLQEVSRRAKVSIGSIYARAPSKESLILAIYERAMDELGAEQEAFEPDDPRWAGMTPRELVEHAVAELARAMFSHEKILAVIINRSAIDPEIARRGDYRVGLLSKDFEQLLSVHGDAYTHPDPAIAVEMAFRMAFATLTRRITVGGSFGAQIDIPDEQLVAELSRAVADYLLAPHGER
jgi:AcrR family transcriptional regulator